MRSAPAGLLLAALLFTALPLSLLRDDAAAIATSWPRHAVADVRPERGLAFQATLPHGAPSAHEGPIDAHLYEDDRDVGISADHDAIRTHGGGRCSFWHGTLWFSSSDGSDPRTNGRRYEVAWRPPSRAGWRLACRALGGVCAALGGLLLLRGRVRRRTWLRLALAFGTLLACLGVLEIVLRLRYPFADSTWPGTFDPAVGLRFRADAEIRRTNLFDFASEQRTNSLGFLDREPRDLQAGERRVVVLGDSFVEAVQVEVAAKFHVRLEHELRQRGVAVATQAFGMSGAGTATELGYWRALGRPLRPALVVVVFVYNDFANNAPLLESIRNGWHPAHAPRPYFTLVDGVPTWQPIDPDWENHVLGRPRRAEPAALDSVLGWSRLCQWTANGVRWIAGTDVERARLDEHDRLVQLRADPALQARLAGWQHPDDLDLDGMVAALDPPPAFREAIALTEHTLAVLRDEVLADGARLLVVLADNLIGPPQPNPRQRPLQPHAWLDLASTICRRLELPVVDLHAAFTERGVVGRTHFVRDRHWNRLGHATAAAVVADRIAREPGLLGR